MVRRRKPQNGQPFSTAVPMQTFGISIIGFAFGETSCGSGRLSPWQFLRLFLVSSVDQAWPQAARCTVSQGSAGDGNCLLRFWSMWI